MLCTTRRPIMSVIVLWCVFGFVPVLYAEEIPRRDNNHSSSYYQQVTSAASSTVPTVSSTSISPSERFSATEVTSPRASPPLLRTSDEEDGDAVTLTSVVLVTSLTVATFLPPSPTQESTFPPLGTVTAPPRSTNAASRKISMPFFLH